MEAMPRPRPKHLHREVSRHGRVVWYVRVGKGKRTRLTAEYGTKKFWGQYDRAVKGLPIDEGAAPEIRSDSFAWLIARYRESRAWLDLSDATRSQREPYLKQVETNAGDVPYRAITEKKIAEGLEKRKAHPAGANCYLKAMRGLFAWAVKDPHVRLETNPAAGVARLDEEEGDGYHTWTEEEVAIAEKAWPLGTRERVALDVLRFTGLRKGDACRLGKQHVRNGVFRIATEKSRGKIEVVAPILPVLAATLAAGPIGDLAFIVGERGLPMAKESFGTWFGEQCAALGLPGRAHGLRKAGATRAAENGATERQLEALFGWSEGSRESARYTKKADRKRLARAAAVLLLKPPDEGEGSAQNSA
jgi:integrase